MSAENIPDEMPQPCCLCNGLIWPDVNGWTGGHNAWPLADGRCCESCNNKVVQERIRQLLDSRRPDGKS